MPIVGWVTVISFMFAPLGSSVVAHCAACLDAELASTQTQMVGDSSDGETCTPMGQVCS